MGLRGDVIAIAVAGVVVVAAGYIASKKIGQTAAKVAPLVDPTSDKNLAYTGVNKVGAALTGEQDFKLGVWLYDMLHPEQAKPVMPEKGYVLPQDFGVLNPYSWD